MSIKDKVRKDGGRFSIFKGDYSQIESAGVEVNLVLTPRVGTINIGMTSAVHQPGQGFNPHVHPLSEETLLVFRGSGEFYLKDRWIPVKEGDIVYAPAGIYHGTRNPPDNTEEFVTIGIASPPQADLYKRYNYDVLATDDKK
jgi:gentisate 1,2-dioxygenase